MTEVEVVVINTVLLSMDIRFYSTHQLSIHSSTVILYLGLGGNLDEARVLDRVVDYLE